jgi:L-alanine-DL-glutamate epimerase-like enolase superfamily enzyme
MGEYTVAHPHLMRDELLTDPNIVKIEKGYAKVPEKPGLGIELNQETLTKYPYRKL